LTINVTQANATIKEEPIPDVEEDYDEEVKMEE